MTDARLVVNHTTWAMLTISSYKVQTAVSRQTTQGGYFMALGVLGLLIGTVAGPVAIAIGGVLLVFGAIVAYRSHEVYELHLVSGGAKVVALRTFDLSLIKRVRAAIDESVGARARGFVHK